MQTDRRIWNSQPALTYRRWMKLPGASALWIPAPWWRGTRPHLGPPRLWGACITASCSLSRAAARRTRRVELWLSAQDQQAAPARARCASSWRAIWYTAGSITESPQSLPAPHSRTGAALENAVVDSARGSSREAFAAAGPSRLVLAFVPCLPRSSGRSTAPPQGGCLTRRERKRCRQRPVASEAAWRRR